MLNSTTFTDDSKYGIVMLRDKKLYILLLGTKGKRIIEDVQSFKIKAADNQQYLIIRKTSELLVLNLTTGQEKCYKDVKDYAVAQESSKVIFTKQVEGRYIVNILRLGEKAEIVLWKGKKVPSRLVIDKSGCHIAFMEGASLFQWNGDYSVEAQLVSLPMHGDCKDLTLSGPDCFSPSGNLLFIKMLGEPIKPINSSINPVQIFTYQDPNFYLDAGRSQLSYTCVYQASTGRLIRLKYDHNAAWELSSDERSVFITHTEADISNAYWNKKGISQSHILFLDTEKKIQIPQRIRNCKMSPSGKWIMGYDNLGKDILFYNVQTGEISNLTANLPISQYGDLDENSESEHSFEVTVYSLTENEKSALVYDHYDIWRIDLEGSKQVENLTNGYGRKHNVQFRFYQQDNKPIINDGNIIIITAFNETTKDNGFFKVRVGSHKDPEVLTMGKYLYCAPFQNVPSYIPVKARDKKIWIVRRMSASESPNYFWTFDFKSFHSVSHVYPEKAYQWYTTELVNYTTQGGVKSQAILYKPENFDTTKKYPVMFNFYEHETAKLNCYRVPSYMDTYYFNFPLMLARGYLICVPDIHFTIGETAYSIVDCIEGAVNQISKHPYVDSKYLGASGGSFGGYGINCLAAFSNKFAALVSISGLSDFVSNYGIDAAITENGQNRMGVSLSGDPDRYLRNSPVAYAKNVKTPLLIVNTLVDFNVNVQQGVEWFVSLRREGKLVWMLRYQNKGHGIVELNDQRDLYTRMNQFFDHYLKGAPAPIWMTRGISANETGVTSGFEYDTEVKTPEPSRLLISEQK